MTLPKFSDMFRLGESPKICNIKRYTIEAAKKFHLVKAPVWIAWSKEDKVFPVSDGEKLEKLFPNARMEVIEDSYCYVAVDNPSGLADSILKFLDSTPLE